MPEWRELTPGEALARGLTPPGPFMPAIKPGANPAKNEQAMRGIINPADLAQNEADFKREAGMTPEGRIPTSSILGGLVSPAVGLLVPPGRTMTRIGGQFLGNVLGQAGAGAAGEAIDRPSGQRDIPGAALEGARRGVLPGLLQGAMGGIFGPNRATLRTQKQIGSVQGSVSPEVAAMMDPKKPASFLKSETPIKMGKEAGGLLDKMEVEVGKQLGDFKFRQIAPSGKLFPKGTDTFFQMRDQIRRLREEAALTYDNNPMAKKKSRDVLAQAKQLEEVMVKQMPPDVAKMYTDATTAHRANMDAVRFVRGVQKSKQIEGGVNPYDRPRLREASNQGAASSPSQMAHGALGALEAATGRPFGAAYNLSRAAGKGKVPNVSESVRGPLASRLPGIAAGTAATLGQNYLALSPAEAGQAQQTAQQTIRPREALQQQRMGERGPGPNDLKGDFQDFLKLDIAEPLLRLLLAPSYGTYGNPKPIFKP